MTLTDLRYIIALASERHFGRAAEKCFVSQPTLSVAVKKLEEELGVALFERSAGEVRATPVGEQIVTQARVALAEIERIRTLAQSGKDPLAGELRLGVIYTIGPYLLPGLVARLRAAAPALQLVLQENYTDRLLEALRAGELDVIVIATPAEEAGLVALPVYDEAFRAVAPAGHPWQQHERIEPAWLLDEPLLMLGPGNCFRDQVLDLCAHADARNGRAPRILEGSSLETLRQMVVGGVGVTVMPASAADPISGDAALCVRPFVEPEPTRRIALVWRSSFPRSRLIDVLRSAILDCRLPGTAPVPAALR
ncbi:MAG: LysR family transcriptional regulator [Gallionellales bacterium GWA2_60_18]|nr:MAG: LysR family transcriptional regulator [Gallionellales bacterium GWA2_60_18]